MLEAAPPGKPQGFQVAWTRHWYGPKAKSSNRKREIARTLLFGSQHEGWNRN